MNLLTNKCKTALFASAARVLYNLPEIIIIIIYLLSLIVGLLLPSHGITSGIDRPGLEFWPGPGLPFRPEPGPGLRKFYLQF